MADADINNDLGSDKPEAGNKVGDDDFIKSTEKRKSGDLEGPPEKKKAIMMNLSGTADKKITMAFGTSKTVMPVIPVKLSLSSQKPKETSSSVKQRSVAVAKAFNDDESDEEEMPPEAKMRMRNIGRDTPTAAGPNSFGKGRLGFCDRQKIIEKELTSQIDDFAGN